MNRILLALLLLTAAGQARAAGPEPSDSTLAYWARAVAERVHVTGYAQTGYTARLNSGADNSNTFDMKRAILMVSADITPRVRAFFMHEFKSGNMQEYYMEYKPLAALNVRVGQSKIEYSIENPLSPTVLESVGPMSQGVSWLCGSDPLMSNPSGRDMGLTVYGDLFHGTVRYVAQIVNGGQINTADHNNQKNVIAKLEWRPDPHIRLSASGVKGYGCAMKASALNPGVEAGETYRSDRYAVGVEWKSRRAP